MRAFSQMVNAMRIKAEVEFFEKFVETNHVTVDCSGTGSDKYELIVVATPTVQEGFFTGANLQDVLHQVYENYHKKLDKS